MTRPQTPSASAIRAQDKSGATEDWQHIVTILSREITTSHLTHKQIARRVGVHPTTISRVWHREYHKSPHAATLFHLLRFFGYRISAQRTRNDPQNVLRRVS